MRAAAANATVLLFAGATAINAPACGGVFVPAPTVLLALDENDFPFPTPTTFTWPTGLLPQGTPLFLQCWTQDPHGGPCVSAASNRVGVVGS